MGQLYFETFGDFRLFFDGEELDLPASKKSRALFAYLFMTNRPQRRERLCELFWDTPNDPKAALRWSLSKLKKSLPESERALFKADRERVIFDRSNVGSDRKDLENILENKALTLEGFQDAKALLSKVFLAGVDLPNLDLFSLWLSDERENILDVKEQLYREAIKIPSLTFVMREQMARDWLEFRPFSQEAATHLIVSLRDQNKMVVAKETETEFLSLFRDAGLDFKVSKPVQTPQKPVREIIIGQKIQFCKSPAGVTLAHASVGSGPPLVKAANWLTHLERDWNAPIWSPLYQELSKDFTFIRYDERGNGLSDWEVEEITQSSFVSDLKTVVDHLNLDKFPLLGISQGAAVSIDYIVNNPGKVSKLILFGGYAKGWRIDATPDTIATREAMMTLTKTGWGQDNPAYRHIFSSTFMPTASSEQLAWFDEFQKETTSPENAVRFLEAFSSIDVRDLLPKVDVPTLVIHSRGDQRIDWTVGRDIATAIPNAEFLTLDSENHLLLEGEPAAKQFLSAVREFLLG
ncbi:alpha/beta fold hydrolase [Hellea sp.]|nr:alpha/beta fold hydrolase [Hellea sp.]